MAVVVGYTRTSEGVAALRFAVDEARAHDDELTVVHVDETEGTDLPVSLEQDLDGVEQLLADAGVKGHVLREARGTQVVGRLLDVVDQVDARLLVIGLRRRSPLGKALLGSNSQQLLLQAPCPVVSVRAAD
ncbi:MAG: universal stress protein [Motilibacteraceae bacterium]